MQQGQDQCRGCSGLAQESHQLLSSVPVPTSGTGVCGAGHSVQWGRERFQPTFCSSRPASWAPERSSSGAGVRFELPRADSGQLVAARPTPGDAPQAAAHSGGVRSWGTGHCRTQGHGTERAPPGPSLRLLSFGEPQPAARSAQRWVSTAKTASVEMAVPCRGFLLLSPEVLLPLFCFAFPHQPVPPASTIMLFSLKDPRGWRHPHDGGAAGRVLPPAGSRSTQSCRAGGNRGGNWQDFHQQKEAGIRGEHAQRSHS